MPKLPRVGRWSLRTRVVALAAVVVAVVLAGGGILLGVAFRQAMVEDLREAAVGRARELAAQASEGALPDPVPAGETDEALVQVVTDGQVVAASRGATGLPAVDGPRPAPGEVTVVHTTRLPVEDDDDSAFLLAATAASADGGRTLVYVASSLDDVSETLNQAATVALAGLPVLVAVLAAAMWLLVDRTLAPVEAIRAEAAAISDRELHRRLPEPEADDEIGRLARTLNQMLARLDHSLARQRQFVADAAHELRTPVASVRTLIETAQSSPRHVDWHDVTDDALAETVRMQHLTDQLLLLARADAAALTPRQQVLDLDDLIARATSTYRGHGDVAVELDVEPVQMSGDPSLLEQAVRNLVDNAWQHATSRIRVTLEHHHDAAVVTVDDDGPGIAPEHRDTVFERFARLDQSRARDRGGTGLGLPIVADIVAAHHGAIDLTDSPLGGARFRLTLPTQPADRS